MVFFAAVAALYYTTQIVDWSRRVGEQSKPPHAAPKKGQSEAPPAGPETGDPIETSNPTKHGPVVINRPQITNIFPEPPTDTSNRLKGSTKEGGASDTKAKDQRAPRPSGLTKQRPGGNAPDERGTGGLADVRYLWSLSPSQVVITDHSVPESASCMQSAFKHLLEEKYEYAIGTAGECIEKFGAAADTMQKELLDYGVPLPVPAELHRPSKEEKAEIFSRSPLNEVGACFWIIGRAYQKLELLEKAIGAYRRVVQYPHAVVWDPEKEQFWWPAEQAAAALEVLLGEKVFWRDKG